MHLLNGKSECANHMPNSGLGVVLNTVEIQLEFNIFSYAYWSFIVFFFFGELLAYVHCPFMYL